ncbi:MAG: CBS domain-containing protein [Gammaproteobacteria bacterium]|nr:CBS domain-containing protein [Gammaproteobacteria bacterium]
MFAIYDIQGRRFRDTLENLRKVRETQVSQGVHSQSDLTEDETLPIPDAGSAKAQDSPVSKKALQAYREMRHLDRREPIYHAYQLMSCPVSTLPAELDILAARRRFQQLGFQQMPVLNTQQQIVGVLTVQDLLRYITIEGDLVRYLGGKRVTDAMSKEVITTDPVSDIRRVAQVMQQYHLQAVPIVDEQDALIGIVSRSDILRALTKDPPLNIWS